MSKQTPTPKAGAPETPKREHGWPVASQTPETSTGDAPKQPVETTIKTILAEIAAMEPQEELAGCRIDDAIDTFLCDWTCQMLQGLDDPDDHEDAVYSALSGVLARYLSGDAETPLERLVADHQQGLVTDADYCERLLRAAAADVRQYGLLSEEGMAHIVNMERPPQGQRDT